MWAFVCPSCSLDLWGLQGTRACGGWAAAGAEPWRKRPISPLSPNVLLLVTPHTGTLCVCVCVFACVCAVCVHACACVHVWLGHVVGAVQADEAGGGES